MPTECNAEHFEFGFVERRAVEAAFDVGLVSSDAGALLLGATDRAIDWSIGLQPTPLSFFKRKKAKWYAAVILARLSGETAMSVLMASTAIAGSVRSMFESMCPKASTSSGASHIRAVRNDAAVGFTRVGATSW